MRTCISKWKKVFAHLESQRLLDSYTAFFKRIKESI